MITNHLEACFFIGFQKHKEAKTNILKYAKYVRNIKITNNLKRKIEQNLTFFVFRLPELPPDLTKIQINLEDFYLPRQPYQFRFNKPHFELEGAFNGNLKKLFKSTKNILDATPNLKEIFLTNAEKELSRKYLPILKRIDIVKKLFKLFFMRQK